MNNIPELIQAAFQAAREATASHIHAHGQNPFGCGFAWATIRPARGPLIAALKAQGIGRKGYEAGWQVWNPSGYPTQDMEAKIAGAHAFARVLRGAGFDVEVGSRLD